MQESAESRVSRVERRKQRTRAALITAAQGFIAQGRLSVPVLDITQAADVGMGSFYNYFDSKEELFAVAVGEALDAHGALLDVLTADVDDPAEAFGCRFRLTGRLFRRRPQESQILLANGVALLTSDRGWHPARCATSKRPSRQAASRSRIRSWHWPSQAARSWALARC